MAELATSVLPTDGSVVKMKGLPFKATKEEVVAFFEGFTLVGEQCIKRKQPDGRPNGEAFVIFDTPEEANRATAKDREVFCQKEYGDRFVRVYPLLENDLKDIKHISISGDSYTVNLPASQNTNETVVRVRGLPMEAKQLDVISFFAGYNLRANGVQILVTSNLKPVGEAFVDFETQAEAQQACAEKDHAVFNQEKFGDRFVRLLLVPRRDMQDAVSSRLGGDGIIKVKGMPFKATHHEVRQFFAGYGVKPDGISIALQADGRPTGMAFVEFESSHEALRAMKKDRARFGPAHGDRFVMLQVATRQDMNGMQLQRESDMLGNYGQQQFGHMMNPMPPGIGSLAPGGSPGMGANMGMSPMPAGIGSLAPGGAQGGMMNQMPGGIGSLAPAPGGMGGNMMSAGMPGGVGTSVPGWQAMMDPASGVVFYQNMQTGERSWTDPMWNNMKGVPNNGVNPNAGRV